MSAWRCSPHQNDDAAAREEERIANEGRLLDNLFTHYDSRVRPAAAEGETGVKVEFDVSTVEISDVVSSARNPCPVGVSRRITL